MESLQGKKALLTGAGKGLGKSMALALAKEGVSLALLGRTEKDLLATAAEAKSLNGSISVEIYVADVSDYSQVKEAVPILIARLGGLDILVNNAGILKIGSFLSLSVEEWEQVFKTNVFGVYYVLREALPTLLEQKSGDIINIASTAGLKGSANVSAYGASKAAVINMTESVMQEVRKSNIRVTNVNPSTVSTDMALNAKLTDGNPDKVLQAADLAAVVVHNLKLPQRAFVKDFSLWSTNP